MLELKRKQEEQKQREIVSVFRLKFFSLLIKCFLFYFTKILKKGREKSQRCRSKEKTFGRGRKEETGYVRCNERAR